MTPHKQEDGPVDQVAFWNGDAGETWTRHQDLIDRMIEPLGNAVLARASIKPGERVLDIGCGCGTTTLELARRVGPLGSVTGVDISKPMLDRARRRARYATRGAKVDFERSDASSHGFKKKTFDIAYSRFGVMFFTDPVGAFKNIRQALTDKGRLVFICWQDMTKNAFFAVPGKAAAAYLPPPEDVDPKAPGPFAFAERDYLEQVLERAGFSNARITPQSIDIIIPDAGGPLQTARFLMDLNSSLKARTDGTEVEKKVQTAVTEALKGRYGPFGPVLGTNTWLVSAAK